MTLMYVNGNYEIRDVSQKLITECGNRVSAMAALAEHGIEDQAIKEAMDNILDHGHHRVVFGINGTFIFSEK